MASLFKKKFPAGKPNIVYWALCGRGDIAQCMLMAGGVDFDLDTENANNFGEYKTHCPFGQLPVLEHGEGDKKVVIAQGGAINRYCARLAGLFPTDPVEASKADMIMEECMDIFQALFKAKNAADKDAKIAAWKMLKEEHLPKHFGFLEKYLEASGKPFFGGNKANAADVTFFAVYGVYDNAGCGADEVLAKFPKLKAVVEKTKDVGKIKDFKRGGHFFCADPENEAF